MSRRDVFSADGIDDGRHDRGRGSLEDYSYTLIPRGTSVTMRLAHSDPFAAEILAVLERVGPRPMAFIERRIAEDERIDAPTAVRITIGGELTGVVGYVPRGLEAVPQALLGRLSRYGRAELIPALIVSTRHGLRVDLLIGAALA